MKKLFLRVHSNTPSKTESFDALIHEPYSNDTLFSASLQLYGKELLFRTLEQMIPAIYFYLPTPLSLLILRAAGVVYGHAADGTPIIREYVINCILLWFDR